MRSAVRSAKIPSPTSSVQRKMAHNQRVPPVSEMRHRTERYENSYSPYKVEVEEHNDSIEVEFENSNFSENIKIPKELKNKETYNAAFGKHDYDLELIAVTLKSDNPKMSEYLEATYWGTVRSNSVDSFVKKNARIVKSKHVLKPKYSTNVTTRFTCTDVNAYTKGRIPNPWCRNTLLLLYENNKNSKKVRDHPKLGIKKNDFSTVYNTDVIKSSYVY